MLHSSLFNETVQLAIDDRLLVLNSAADPFVPVAAQRIPAGELVLAEDNIAALRNTQKVLRSDRFKTFRARHVPFHHYTVYEPPSTCNVAVMNTLYQPANAWMQYGLQLAAYALQPGGRLYVQGAKDRGIVSLAKHMQTLFGNVETLEISKGERVVCSFVSPDMEKQGCHSEYSEESAFATRGFFQTSPGSRLPGRTIPTLFAAGKMDEGTRM